MRNEWIDRAFGQTPAAFSERIDWTLDEMKEEYPVKKWTVRTVLAAALVIALLSSMAYAAITQGMEWYYSNRFTAYQEHEPERHEAILEALQTVERQQSTADEWVNVTVQQAAWTAEEQMLVVSLAAVPQQMETAELHPMWNLDADGSYVGPQGEEAPESDGEDRAEHWLWTEKGFGPVKEMMGDPQKELFLFDTDTVYLGTPEQAVELRGDGSSMDAYVSESGEVMTVLEVRLDWMRDDYEEELRRRMQENPDMAAFWQQQLEQAKVLRQRTAEADTLTFSVPYTVTKYTENDEELYAGGQQGWVTFELDIR